MGKYDQNEPWCDLLAEATAPDHIVQLYQDEKFLSRAVCRFAVSALDHGEGVILVPTHAHWSALRPRLEAEGVDTEAAQAIGQLTVVDADLFQLFLTCHVRFVVTTTHPVRHGRNFSDQTIERPAGYKSMGTSRTWGSYCAGQTVLSDTGGRKGMV